MKDTASKAIKGMIKTRPGKASDGKPLPPVSKKIRRAPSQAEIEAKMAKQELRVLDKALAKTKRDFDNEFQRVNRQAERISQQLIRESGKANRKLLAISKAARKALEQIERRRAIVLGRLASN